MPPIKFITQELVLKDVFPDNFKSICEEHGLNDDAQFIRKGLVASDLKFEEGERAVVSHITTDTVDRDGEVVDPKGAILEDYEKNPVVLFGHDHRGLPIGRNMWIKRDKKGLVAKTAYATHQLAEDVYQYRKQGFPLAQSIGFIPLQSERYEEGSDERKQGIYRKFTKWILLEYSDVPIPSNPDAVAIAISKGLIPKDYEAKDIDKEKEDDSSSTDIEGSLENKEDNTNILEQEEVKNEESSSEEKHSAEVIVNVVKEEEKLIKEKMNFFGIEIDENELERGQEALDRLFLEIFPPERCPHLYTNEYGQKLIARRDNKLKEKESEDDTYLIEEDVEKETPEGSIFVDPEIIKSIVSDKLETFKKEFKEVTTNIIKDEFNRMRGKV